MDDDADHLYSGAKSRSNKVDADTLANNIFYDQHDKG